jgi:glycosyltransferase involved in cell wall biosynthesis/MoaA/NifB/PqqE/SkfB family radical SAM enzyme
MKILQVIHGYPMRFNAGSEIYTSVLSRVLAAEHEVNVFSREEDSFSPDYTVRVERDPAAPEVTLHLVNLPRTRDRYRHVEVDARFRELLAQFNPDVVHIGHLNHLSTSLVTEAARKCPVVFTLHDFWLMCPRGQFMQTHPKDSNDLWPACGGQEDRKCAERCYAKLFSGAPEEWETDVRNWTDWVGRRMKHIRSIAELVDVFISPSQYLLERFARDFALPRSKLHYLPYGFDLNRLAGRRRESNEPLTFGYIGTHIPAKGIHLLLEAFSHVTSPARLKIWGRSRSPETPSLKQLANRLPANVQERIEWLPEYTNENIVRDVFNHVDAIVVPSVWVENSPLVIHEAMQARVPVITADAGGMAELIRDGENGLLFKFRDAQSLAERMQWLALHPKEAIRLGERGYLNDSRGNVPELNSHVRSVVGIYDEAIARKRAATITPLRGPWRITFDTNPDDCNLHCIMCEEHSPHSELQARRRAEGRPPRRMSLELIRKTVAEAAARGLQEIIPSTMGEPLLYDEFEEILGICREYKVRLNLTTNGTFPRLGARRWAELIVPVTSDTKISWNGASGETHEAIMLGTKWERGVDNVREFITVRDEVAMRGENRCRVTLQLTFLESNVAELPEIVRLAANVGVDRVKGHHVWAHFRELQPLNLRRNADSIRRWNDAVSQVREVTAQHLLPNGQAVLLENFHPLDGAVANASPTMSRCPFLGREAWVSAEGRFSPCCAPDAQRRALGEFGNLNDRSLGEIWDSREYQHLVQTYHSRPLCQQCTLRQPV